MNTPLLDRAAAYLDRLPPAISGSGGHSATYRAATVLMHGFALGETEALPLLTAWNHTHCQPPWTERDLRHKLRSAAQSAASATRPPGYLVNSEGKLSTSRPFPAASPESDSARKARQRAAWPEFRPLKPALIDRIAELRHLLPDAVDLAQRHGFLSGAVIDGHASYLLHEGTFAQARRLDGLPFIRPDGSAVKAKNLPGSEGVFIGQKWLGPGLASGPDTDTGDPGSTRVGPPRVLLVEGAIGLLEALAAFLLAEVKTPWVLLAATSASSRFSRDPALLAKLAGRHVRLLPDADEAGMKAGTVWMQELRAAGATVDGHGLPSGCKDLGPILADPTPHQTFLNALFK